MRNISKADKSTKEGMWEKKKLRGMEVSGKKWGIIGFGHVGQLVAGLLSGFKCEIIAYDPYVSKEIAVASGAKLVGLDELLKESDIISIHVPLLDSTLGMIGSKELSMMKGSAILINISRGGIVDEKALYTALKENRIGGAALDVFEKEPPSDSPLLKLENTVFTPHLGAQTTDAQRRVGEKLVERISEALS
jgi:D-3-phosphoglycerate dehydrogenase